jgi:hypothetical protein
MDLHDDEAFRELAWRIDAKDVEWFSARYRSGELAWAEELLGSRDYGEMGRRIEIGDLGWVGTSLATLDLPGFDVAGPLLDKPRAPLPLATDPVPQPIIDNRVAAPVEQPRDGRSKLWLLLPLLIVLFVVGFLLSRCGGDDAGVKQLNLVDSAAQTGQLTKWNEAVNTAGLTGALKAKGPLTAFAPTRRSPRSGRARSRCSSPTKTSWLRSSTTTWSRDGCDRPTLRTAHSPRSRVHP